MEEIKKQYAEAFKLHGDSSKAVMWPKGRQAERFSVLTSDIKKNAGKFSVLDFGCGLAHLYDYLQQHHKDFSYTGVDMVPEFLKHNALKHPDAAFRQVDDFMKNCTDSFDYVVISGAFNIRYVEDEKEHEQLVFSIIEKLFAHTNVYLAADFMTDQVDFKQETTYHAKPADVMNLAFSKLSRRVIIDHSYLPYEYCLKVFKQTEIKRPDNIYA
jgi:SAM-dependent methyltransferase